MKNLNYYENTDLKDLTNEAWVDSFGFDGLYEVSNLGRVKSLGRWVSNGKSERWVKERILKQAKQKKDDRLSVMLSQNNIAKSYQVSTIVYYSFNPEKMNDNLRDEVYHKNKVQDDNKLVNLGYNVKQGASYSISIKLGNVKHLEFSRKAVHRYTKETAIIKNGIVTDRKCRKCNQLKSVNLFEYKRNTCVKCRNLWKRENYLKTKKNNKI
tara:strand:- start:1682 stop:2314 length:633 start_codon:yes stop_codon:yes gene_type:complete